MLPILALTVVIALAKPAALAQVTSNVFLRTFMVKSRDELGTAFTMDVDARQYLITAKHIVVGMKDVDIIQVRRGDEWVPLKVTVLRCADHIDIAVLIPPHQISVSYELEPGMKDVEYGQEIYFVGFPYGLFTEGTNVNGMFPLAFIKRGTMSASTKEGNATVIYLDGHNNPGFSGGPVVFRDFSKSGYVLKVLGVVSGFPAEYTPVFEKQEIKASDVTEEDRQKQRIILQNGKVFRLKETSAVVPLNTAIVKAYSIEQAVDLIKSHSTGPLVSPNFNGWSGKE